MQMQTQKRSQQGPPMSGKLIGMQKERAAQKRILRLQIGAVMSDWLIDILLPWLGALGIALCAAAAIVALVNFWG